LLTRHKIEPVVASEVSITNAIEKYYGNKNDRFRDFMEEIEEDTEGFQAQASTAELVDGNDKQEDGPIIGFVNAMLTEAIKMKASDIHIEPYEKRFRVRFRIDGSLVEKIQPPSGAATAICSRIKVLSK